MSFRQTLAISRAPMAALAAVGVFWGGFSALVPDIKAGVNASDADFGLAMMVSAVGGITSMYLAPRAGALLGRSVLPVFGVALAAAFFFPVLAGSVPGLALAFLGIGMSVAMLDISANMRLGVLEARHKLHLMNVNHAAFSFAFGFTALFTGFARKAGYGPEVILPVLALVSLGLVAIMWAGRGRVDVDESAGAEEPKGAQMPWMAVFLTSVILLASFIGENATEAWSALHIERTLGAPAGEGGYGPFMLGLMMGFGRLSGQFFSERLGETRVIFYSALLGAIGAVVIALAPTKEVVILGVGVLGLGMAVIVPSANSVLGKRVPEHLIGVAISRAWMLGFIGFFAGPTLMGLVSEFAGLRVAFLFAAAIVALILPAIWKLGQFPTREET